MSGNIIGFIIWCIMGVLFIGLGIFAFTAKKAVGFWANAKMFEVTDVKIQQSLRYFVVRIRFCFHSTWITYACRAKFTYDSFVGHWCNGRSNCPDGCLFSGYREEISKGIS